MKPTIIIPILTLGVGSALGFVIGKNGSADIPDTVNAASERSAVRVAGKSSRAKPGNEASRVRTMSDALATTSQSGRIEALMDYFSKLDPTKFSDEADKLEGLSMGERMMVGYLLFSRWGEEDPLAAMEYTKSMGRIGGFFNSMAIRSWASTDPVKVAEYYSANPGEFANTGRGPMSAGGTVGVIAAEWVKQDQTGAMDWALGLQGRSQELAVRSIFSQVASDDPASAALLLSSISDSGSREEAINTLAAEWGAEDWGAAQAWISSLPADEQSGATSRALRGLANVDYASAAVQLSSLPEGSEYSNTMEVIARQWSAEDPAAAAAWVMENGNADAQEESIGDAVSSWVGVDAVAALSFVNEQPAGDVRDEAALSYVRANRSGDISTNLELAESITSERDRARAMVTPISIWMQEDEESATAYVNETDSISDDIKQRIISRASGNGGRRGGR